MTIHPMPNARSKILGVDTHFASIIGDDTHQADLTGEANLDVLNNIQNNSSVITNIDDSAFFDSSNRDDINTIINVKDTKSKIIVIVSIAGKASSITSQLLTTWTILRDEISIGTIVADLRNNNTFSILEVIIDSNISTGNHTYTLRPPTAVVAGVRFSRVERFNTIEGGKKLRVIEIALDDTHQADLTGSNAQLPLLEGDNTQRTHETEVLP